MDLILILISNHTIDSDYQVKIYSDDFVNEKNILRDDNINTSGLIGNISSLKIEPRSEDEIVACTFYEEKNYTGNSFKLSYGEHNMSELIKKGVSYDNLNGMFLLRSVLYQVDTMYYFILKTNFKAFHKD